jgi:ComF family protein
MQGNFFPKEKMITAAIRDIVADLLFPKTCVDCGREGSFLCDDCIATIPPERKHGCPFCRHKTPLGATCLSCSRSHSLDGVFPAASYRKNRALGSAIHVMKYEFVDGLGDRLGRFLGDAVLRTELPLPGIIVPVPLHPWRFRFRGFNQAMIIARALSSHIAADLNIPVREDILFRTRFTLPQTRSRDARERRKNLHDAFSLSKDKEIRSVVRGMTIWLVDDVATTGATLEECATILKKAGAKKIIGIVLAR